MSKVVGGGGVQVVSPCEDHTFLLNKEALQSLLLADDVKDRAVVLLSVAGAFRKGKSFLLSFFLRYLKHVYEKGGSEDDWLGTEDAVLEGFSWRGGSERYTTGIHFWSQPFKTTLENGEKVVILLMDTQGTFDSESTVKDNATVFALSTMLSSVQIYNLSQNIEEDDLQHLQLFMDYGCVAKDKIEGKPFQTLQFLVRDWSYPYNHAYGAVGGKELLDKRLEVKENQHDELQMLRQHIARCFEELTCFLMPHPGLKVATDPNFTGKLADIQPEFKDALKELVPLLLTRDNLIPKVIDGQRIKAKDLVNYFSSYVDIFNSEELPQPTTILQATAEANNRSAMTEAYDVYKSLMEEVCGGTLPYVDPGRLDEEHRRVANKALHNFDSKKKMGGQEMSEKFREELIQELQEQYASFASHNESKNLYRMFGTPIVFVMLIVLGYLLSVVCDTFGVAILVSAGRGVSIGAVVLFAVWTYTRLTGNMRDIGIQLDSFASTLRSYVQQQTIGPAHGLHSTHTSTATYYDEKKDT